MGFIKACLICLASAMVFAILMNAALAIWSGLGLVLVGLVWWFLLSGSSGNAGKDYRGGDYDN